MKRLLEYFKNNKIIATACAVGVTVVLSAVLAVTFYSISRATVERSYAVDTEAAPNNEMRGVWVATIGNINYPSDKDLSANEMKRELERIVENCFENGFNTIFFQVRPSGDAVYPSEIFPWSEYISGEQGDAPHKKFDSLAYLIEEASKAGIEVHAWINPFRITNGSPSKPKTDVEDLSVDNPARINPEYTVAYADGKLYYNPGLPEVHELVISGIVELCENYPDLAGIHFDDYFYPYPSGDAEFDDAAAFEEYGDGMELADWRRQNVNTLVEGAYKAVKSVNEEMRFGVSPFGIWANKGSDTYLVGSETTGLEAYKSLYCDAIAWARGGYVDYLVPQIYWEADTKAAPFDVVANWWNANLDGTGVDLYVGHAAYKAADYTAEELGRQVEFSRNLMTYKGSVFYGYEYIIKNTDGLSDVIKSLYAESVWYEEPESTGEEPGITFPTEEEEIVDDSVNIFGTSDPAYPVEIQGERVSRTKDGYFSHYTKLDNGRNEISLTSKEGTYGFMINKVNEAEPGAEMKEFEIKSVYPSKETWLSAGDTLEVSCTAPAGSKVTAKIGGISLQLSPTKYSSSTAKNYEETYTGKVKIPTSFAGERGSADIGTLTFTVTKGTKTVQKIGPQVKQLGKGALLYAEVINDYSYLKVAPDSSFYDDPSPASIGMRDYITGYEDGFYKLSCGYYISEDNVKTVSDDALYRNKILDVVVEPYVKNTANNKDNYTDVRFAVLENVPVKVDTLKDKVTITFFNTDVDILPAAIIEANPMVKSVASRVVGKNAVYEITLKAAENYYGFNTVYEDSMIIFRLNNPQSLEEGELPLYGKTIIIDPGHGGVDGGAPAPSGYGRLDEADLNLSIATELRKNLTDLGANVIMTRDTDVTVDLVDRIDILASMIPDMAISIHHNSASAAESQLVSGYLGLYSDCAGITLAHSVADTLCAELARYKNPIRYQKLAVARNHRFPSTLCEMNFICNISEYQWSVAEGSYKRSADALAHGILEFYKRQAKYLKY